MGMIEYFTTFQFITDWKFYIGMAILLFIYEKTKDYSISNQKKKVKDEEKSEEEEEATDYEICDKCKKKVYTDKEGEIDVRECEECEDNCCKNCSVYFEERDIVFCKECIDKKYPKGKVIYKDRIIEKPIEIIKYVDKEGKPVSTFQEGESKFD